jgi:hypothetical protein
VPKAKAAAHIFWTGHIAQYAWRYRKIRKAFFSEEKKQKT